MDEERHDNQPFHYHDYMLQKRNPHDGSGNRSLLKAILNQDLNSLLAFQIEWYDVTIDIQSNLRTDLGLNRFDTNVTSMMIASHLGHEGCVRSIITLGVNLHRLYVVYKRSLLLAARGGHAHCIRLLSRHALFQEKIIDEDLSEAVQAIENLDCDLFQRLLARGYGDVTWMKRTDASNVMNLLISHGCSVECLQTMVDKGVPLDQPDRHGLTPLACAVICGQMEYVQFLLEKGANVNARDNRKHYRQFDVEIESPFANLRKTNDIEDEVYGNGKTALAFAAILGRVQLAKFLLENGADLNVTDEGGFTSLMHAAYHNNKECCREIITSNKLLDIDKIDKMKRTALIHAAYSGAEDCVQILLKTRAKRFLKDSYNRNAFMAAVAGDNTKCALHLLKFQVEIFHRDTKGETALLYAAENGNLELLNALIEKVKNPIHLKRDDSKNIFNVPLFRAVKSNRIDCVELLIEHGVDVNARNDKGETPLMHACDRNYSDIFFLLIKHGANIKAISRSSGKNMLMWALKSDRHVFEYLLTNGVKVNHKERNGKTPLILACRKGMVHHTKLLINHGADLDLQNNSNIDSALVETVLAESIECFELLLDAGANIALGSYNENVLLRIVQRNKHTFLDILLEKRDLFEGNKLKAIFAKSFRLDNVHNYTNRTMLSLMKHGIFQWSWYPCRFNSRSKLPFSVVLGGISPGVFKDMPGCRYWHRRVRFSEEKEFLKTTKVSPLIVALLSGKLNLSCYLLANLFFTVDDYRMFLSNFEFQSIVKKNIYHEADVYTMQMLSRFPSFPTVFDSLTTKPVSLQTLCLITASSCISFNGRSVREASRAEQVDSLPIPARFKRRLKFQGPLAKLCPQYWKHIATGPLGSNEYQDLLSLSTPIYPYPECLVPCNTKCSDCEGLGLAVKE